MANLLVWTIDLCSYENSVITCQISNNSLVLPAKPQLERNQKKISYKLTKLGLFGIKY